MILPIASKATVMCLNPFARGHVYFAPLFNRDNTEIDRQTQTEASTPSRYLMRDYNAFARSQN